MVIYKFVLDLHLYIFTPLFEEESKWQSGDNKLQVHKTKSKLVKPLKYF